MKSHIMNKELGDRYSWFSDWGDFGPGLREASAIEVDAGDAAAAKAEAEERRKQEDESEIGDRFE